MAAAARFERAINALGYGQRPGDLVVRSPRRHDPARAFVWRELQRKTPVDAAYFQGAVPLVAFAEAATDEAVASLHRDLWNFGRVPLLVAITDVDVEVYSCFSAPSAPDDARQALLRVSALSSELGDELSDFTRAEVETGRFVAAYAEKFDRRQRVDRRLLANLSDLRYELHRAYPGREIDALLGSSILVRYLEDRGILGTHQVPWPAGVGSYTEVLRSGLERTIAFLVALDARFHGDVFSQAVEELSEVDDDAVVALAAFLEGEDLRTGQQTFWPYDFSIISPELISSIYEQLLEETKDEDAAYYTPRHVVDLMLDQVLPWGSRATKRVLDPACGSGIFLTEAFRRMCFAAAVDDDLDATSAAEILTSAIFGCDQSLAATQVAAFSLYLALFEEVRADLVWDTVRLPRLIGENLVVSDFFEADIPEDAFDLIVGNPPWRSALTPAAEAYVEARGLAVADKQMATAFLWRAGDLAKERGSIALLLPSKSILHNRSRRAVLARQSILREFSIETVIDLSALRRSLFTDAVAPGAVIVASPASDETGSRGEILHLSPHRGALQAGIDGFVLAADDMHEIPRRLVEAHTDAFTIFLWGDEDDFNLVTEMRARHRTLGELVTARGWICHRGYQEFGGDSNKATVLQGLPRIRATAVHPFRVDVEQVDVFDRDVVHRLRTPALYLQPKVLIRRGLVDGRIAAVFVAAPAAFNDSIIGVAASPGEERLLKLVEACLNSSVAAYYQFLTGSSWGVERDYVEQNEHLGMPLPSFDDVSDDATSMLDEIRATALASGQLPQAALDQVVFELYGFGAREADIIGDAVADRRARVSGVDSAFRMPGADQLRTYRESLLKALAATFPSATATVEVEQISDGYLAALVSFDGFEGGRPPAIAEVRSALQTMKAAVSEWESPSVVVLPSSVVLLGGAVAVVKPAEARLWSRRRARADAASIAATVLSGSATEAA